jgi:probable F420-dependent oxidoreductase
MKLGVRWPDFEVPIDRGVVHTFVQAVDDLGFDHITAFDHLAGMSSRTRRGWRMDYMNDKQWAESLTLLSHMSGLSDRLGFMTAILGLPNRPTVLVAKQVATIDRMCEGRLRLGVGLGWNDIEFAISGNSFEDRAERMEEQVEVLRQLWTKEEVSFRGDFHRLPAIGLSLTPVQQPIPIWMAATMASGPKVLRRIARLADGVIPEWPPGDEAREKMAFIFEEARKVGRDPAEIGAEPKIALRAGAHRAGTDQGGMKADEELAAEVAQWQEIGVTHVEFKSRSCGLVTIEEHLREASRFKEIADSVLC